MAAALVAFALVLAVVDISFFMEDPWINWLGLTPVPSLSVSLELESERNRFPRPTTPKPNAEGDRWYLMDNLRQVKVKYSKKYFDD